MWESSSDTYIRTSETLANNRIFSFGCCFVMNRACPLTYPADFALTRKPSTFWIHLEEQGLGWTSAYATGIAGDAITSGLEVTWTSTPTKWSNDFFEHLFKYDWELTKSPGGAHQWKPKGNAGENTVPDAHNSSKRHAPAMLTTDLSLRFDPVYEKISRRFYENPAEFAEAFARAWFRLTHRDMGAR
jgi:catalase (peroxidase I)